MLTFFVTPYQTGVSREGMPRVCALSLSGPRDDFIDVFASVAARLPGKS